jgi:hypothetical protein
LLRFQALPNQPAHIAAAPGVIDEYWRQCMLLTFDGAGCSRELKARLQSQILGRTMKKPV